MRTVAHEPRQVIQQREIAVRPGSPRDRVNSIKERLDPTLGPSPDKSPFANSLKNDFQSISQKNGIRFKELQERLASFVELLIQNSSSGKGINKKLSPKDLNFFREQLRILTPILMSIVKYELPENCSKLTINTSVDGWRVTKEIKESHKAGSSGEKIETLYSQFKDQLVKLKPENERKLFGAKPEFVYDIFSHGIYETKEDDKTIQVEKVNNLTRRDLINSFVITKIKDDTNFIWRKLNVLAGYSEPATKLENTHVGQVSNKTPLKRDFPNRQLRPLHQYQKSENINYQKVVKDLETILDLPFNKPANKSAKEFSVKGLARRIRKYYRENIRPHIENTPAYTGAVIKAAVKYSLGLLTQNKDKLTSAIEPVYKDKGREVRIDPQGSQFSKIFAGLTEVGKKVAERYKLTA